MSMNSGSLARIVIGVVAGSTFLLCCLGGSPIEPIFFLVAGWGFFLARVLPEMHLNAVNTATALVSLVFLVLGTQAFCNWLYGERGAGERAWPMRWTVAIVGVVVLMFMAGIAM